MKVTNEEGVKHLWRRLLRRLKTKESSSNKKTSIDEYSTDADYPSAKAVYGFVNEKVAEGVGLALKAIYNVVVLDNDDTANNTTSFASVCSITGAANSGKMQTIIYKNETENVVDEDDNAIVSQQDLYITIPSSFVTPNGSQIVLLCPVGGYCEVNYLNIGGTIYARGL